jgi:hypothetical protein
MPGCREDLDWTYRELGSRGDTENIQLGQFRAGDYRDIPGRVEVIGDLTIRRLA